MAFFKGVQDLRTVNWGKQYLWDVKFIDPTLTKPFDQWFPAQDVEDSYVSIESKLFEGGITSFKIPVKKTYNAVRLTFIDDAAYSLFNFFEQWMNVGIVNDEQYVATLSEAVKTLQIAKLDHDRSIVRGQVRTLKVYPEGTLAFHGTNSSDPHNYSVTLVIAGRIKQ